MDKAIITVLLIVAGVVCVTFAFNAIYPAVSRGSDAVLTMADAVGDKIKTQVEIIHAASEYDPDDAVDHWNDVNSNSTFDIFAWVKNIGTSRILGIKECDIFFGEEGDFRRIPHEDYAGGSKPYWEYTLEDGADDWASGKTLKITIVYASSYASSGLSADTTYLIKFITPEGISDEINFSW